MNKTLVLAVYAPGDYSDGRVVATAPLTADLVAFLQARAASFLAARAAYPDLYETVEYGSPFSWLEIGMGNRGPYEEDPTELAKFELLEAALDGDLGELDTPDTARLRNFVMVCNDEIRAAVVPDDYILGRGNIRADCERFVMRSEKYGDPDSDVEFRCSCYPKHSSAELETASFTLAELEKWLEDLVFAQEGR